MIKKRSKSEAKAFKKAMIRITMVQSVLLLLFFAAFYSSIPREKSGCINKVIRVEKIDYRRAYNRDGHWCYVISNGVEYKFSQVGHIGENEAKKIYDKLSVGDNIEIIYEERIGLFGKYNLILGASSENEVYLDFENNYNHQRSAFVLVIIVCSVFEAFYVIIVISCLIFNKVGLGLKKRKKRHYIKQ